MGMWCLISKTSGANEHIMRPPHHPPRTINLPIYSASTVLFNRCEDLFAAVHGQYEGVAYGTEGLPNQQAFEAAMRAFEGGALTRTFQSGISAITHTLQAFTNSGDHIVVCENVYGPTARFCHKILSRFKIDTTFVPSAVGKDIDKYIRPNTRLIFLESPGSNTFEIQDIPAVTAIAQKKGIITVIDNTWATPLYLDAFALGVDCSIQSVTKYISGHSDVLLGTVSVNEKWAELFDDYYQTCEIFAPSQECYLSLRGLHTLSLRLKQHETSALAIAKKLQSVDLIETVLHPALPEHPQHHLWKRDFKGASGLFAFTFKKEYGDDEIARFVNRLVHFGIGFSWGGYKSLITAGKYRRESDIPSLFENKIIIRLSIGLEDCQMLMSDLEKAFEALP